MTVVFQQILEMSKLCKQRKKDEITVDRSGFGGNSFR